MAPQTSTLGRAAGTRRIPHGHFRIVLDSHPVSACPICGSGERPFARAQVLAKYDVAYFFCEACRFLHTEKPYWLDEAYADAIVATDTGIVRRNLDCSAKSAALFSWMFRRKGRYLDLAGGYGLLTRLMRDMGFDYYWSDPYADNLFARGFEGPAGAGETFIATTAFEVLEHLEDPLGFVREAFGRTQCEAFLFSTELYSGPEPPREWAYYSRESGQHISFFHRNTLQTMASMLNLEFHSNAGMHLFSRRHVNPLAFALLTSRVSAKVAGPLFAAVLRTRINGDHADLLERSQQRREAG
jgi:2-polyprenyl-3-methyl-5-hydroxy-6-metoxy-1,4-benzoquinol methylase